MKYNIYKNSKGEEGTNEKIFSALIFVLIAIFCLSSAAFAEEENEIALMSMSGGLSFTEFALYDESGATSAII